MKIYYISTAEIPSDKANSIQVVKMCAAMTQSGHVVRLLLPDYAAQRGYSSEDVKAHYGLNSEFDIKRVKLSKFLGKPRFLWQSVNTARRDQVDLIFTRSLEAAVFLIPEVTRPEALGYHYPCPAIKTGGEIPLNPEKRANAYCP